MKRLNLKEDCVRNKTWAVLYQILPISSGCCQLRNGPTTRHCEAHQHHIWLLSENLYKSRKPHVRVRTGKNKLRNNPVNAKDRKWRRVGALGAPEKISLKIKETVMLEQILTLQTVKELMQGEGRYFLNGQ